MGTTKRIVCLANSRKWNGRCIAGREYGVAHAGWVRPVSDRPQGELSGRERWYQGRSEPSLLDIIEVPFAASRPKDYQQENWLIDPWRHWKKVGTLPWSRLESFAAPADFTLWSNGNSSVEGKNDRVPFEEAKSFTSSLELVYEPSFRLRISDSVDVFGDKSARLGPSSRSATLSTLSRSPTRRSKPAPRTGTKAFIVLGRAI
jgi:hypothetical protein